MIYICILQIFKKIKFSYIYCFIVWLIFNFFLKIKIKYKSIVIKKIKFKKIKYKKICLFILIVYRFIVVVIVFVYKIFLTHIIVSM